MVKLNGAQIHTEEFEEQMKNLEPSDIHRLLGYFKYEFQTKNKIIYNIVHQLIYVKRKGSLD